MALTSIPSFSKYVFICKFKSFLYGVTNATGEAFKDFNANIAAVNGLVTFTPGFTFWQISLILEGPMTIDAEVHPKARTSNGIPGRINLVVSSILSSMAAKV